LISYIAYVILDVKVRTELSKTTFRERSQMSKYYCLNDAKKSIANKGLTSRLGYLKFLRDNNITHLSATPETTYWGRGWKGYADYLSCPVDVYKRAIAENRRKKNPFTQDVTFTPVVPVTAPVEKPVDTSLNADKVIAFLIEENIDPHTIIRMIAKLNITDTTCFVDVCRYLESSKHQRTLKPSAYNTLGQGSGNR
jgi:hypothetical protein